MLIQSATAGARTRLGVTHRQSSPSNSASNCARVSRITPSLTAGQAKRPSVEPFADESLAVFAALIAYFLDRREWLAARASGASVATLAEVSYAIPSLVISIAFILVFIRPILGLGFSLYNTLTLIFLAYLTAWFSIALKPVTAAAAQLDPALDDAARVADAGFGRRMRRIYLPLVAPAAVLVFPTACNEVTVSALLWSTGNETIGTAIFNYEDGGHTSLAAAMATLTVAATVVLMAVLDRAGRRLPPGVVPWRI